MAIPRTGRDRQKSRTRRQILDATARLMQERRALTLEEIADTAQVSRATAYRYFPGLDALLAEAAVDTMMPEAGALFGAGASTDPAARLDLLDREVDVMMDGNEAALRAMLAHSVTRRPGPGEEKLPRRQNRRLPLIEAALAPVREQLGEDREALLAHALAILIGTEGMIVLKDVLELDAPQARRVKSWAIAALVRAALDDAAADEKRSAA